ncbi:hypothetical protein AB6A40_005783 [Gnathostoma spinigerum]|uniref:UDENN domain-containing protein n=1 Tax=Gnathostoma spinigerum TaxID=75299 RepID=A0ABD6ELP5_9BILA
MDNPIILIAVIGFHHKKGCQVEYCYPSFGESISDIPEPWQNLPSLALPDGAHNTAEDVIYFLLPSLENPNNSVFGISCYRQIAAQVKIAAFFFFSLMRDSALAKVTVIHLSFTFTILDI